MGVVPGMSVSAACALVPGLRLMERDEAAEYRALQGIATWAWQFSSRVSLSPPRAVLLEISGNRRLLPDLRVLTERLEAGLTTLGYRAVIATASTPLAALLFARAGRCDVWIENPADLEGAIGALALRYTELPPETVTALRRAGVHTLGQCRRLPRDGLLRRFGPGCLDYLDRLFGERPDPRPLFDLPERFDHTLNMPAEVDDAEAVLFALRRLLQELEGFLRARQKGVQTLDVELLHPRKQVTRITLRLTQPTGSESHMTRLLRERLARIRLSDLVEAIRLRATTLHPLALHTHSLLKDRQANDEPLAHFLERLQARLGDDTVLRVGPRPEHRPERAWRYCQPSGDKKNNSAPGPRPFWLLPEPRRLRMERNVPCLSGRLRLLAGPERVESGWWDGGDTTRDYFVAGDERGGRYWVFRNRRPPREWFLHGIFA